MIALQLKTHAAMLFDRNEIDGCHGLPAAVGGKPCELQQAHRHFEPWSPLHGLLAFSGETSPGTQLGCLRA